MRNACENRTIGCLHCDESGENPTLLNTVLPVKSCQSFSTVGIGYFFLIMPSFVRRISTQIVTSPSLFGTTTKAEIQPNGPSSTSSMTSAYRSSSSFSSTFSRRPNSILHTGCATGLTDLSKWNLSSESFRRPIPVRKSGYPQQISFLMWSNITLITLSGPTCNKRSVSTVSCPKRVRRHPGWQKYQFDIRLCCWLPGSMEKKNFLAERRDSHWIPLACSAGTFGYT